MKVERRKVVHRDFLGAHRYTPRGGTVRPAGGVLQTAVVCLRQPIGDVALPLRFASLPYPFAGFALGEDPQSGASPGASLPCCHGIVVC